MLHGLHVPLWKLWTARPQNVFEIGQIEIEHRIRTRKACHASDWLVYLDQIHTCYNTIVWDPEPPRINLPLVKRADTRATKQILNQVLSCQHPQYQNQSTRQARFQFHGSTCIMCQRSWVCGLSISHPRAAVSKNGPCIDIYVYKHRLASCWTSSHSSRSSSFLAGQHLTIQPLLQGSCRDLGKHGAWETPMMLMVSVLWYHHYHTSFTTYTNIITP